jgi:hypothetical protein
MSSCRLRGPDCSSQRPVPASALRVTLSAMSDGPPYHEPLRVHLVMWGLGLIMALWFTNYLYGWVDLGQLLR